jgi:hypothetical protein
MMRKSSGYDKQWGDARLVCATPAKIEKKESAAARAVGTISDVWGVVAVGSVMALFGVM